MYMEYEVKLKTIKVEVREYSVFVMVMIIVAT